LDRIIRATSQEGDTVLDPFCGSGTTAIAAIRNKRKFIGIEQNIEYLELTLKRIQKEKANG
jgi:site-specific DNA-methyltransferase (adenine-specific)